MTKPHEPATLFLAYADEDKQLCKTLERHLTPLQREGLISTWHAQHIPPGTNWEQKIDEQLNRASIILLLISSDFVASDYCYEKEMQRALEQHERGDVCVIPIILRPCDWQHLPLKDLQCLPDDGKPVTEWDNLDAAFLDITKGLRRVIEQPTSVPSFPSAPHTFSERPTFHGGKDYREHLLKDIRDFWIEKMLKPRLNEMPLIPLGLHVQPDAVHNPWQALEQESKQPEYALPPDTSIIKVYEDADRRLLILGESGAGKTTLLLELVRHLLEQAEHDNTSRMPVVLFLSSWPIEKQTFSDWLRDELSSRYRIPSQVGQEWIKNEQLVLLLDGLDEVASRYREQCIDGINAYRSYHDSTPIVVCSRRAEYLAQKNQLRLQKAVVLQPLTMKQIDDYLLNEGRQLAAVYRALHNDLVLKEIVTTPLMLKVVTRTYGGRSMKPLKAMGSTEAQRQQIFDDYIQSLFERRKQETKYTPQQTIDWLAWLARQMKQQQVTVFYPEGMKIGLLSTRGLFWSYCLVMLLICGLTGGPLGGGAGYLIGAYAATPLGGASGGLLGMLVPTLLLGFRTISWNYRWWRDRNTTGGLPSLSDHGYRLDKPPYWPLLHFFPSKRAFFTRYAQYMITGMSFCISCLNALLCALFLAGSSLLSWSHFPLWDRLEIPCFCVFFLAALLFSLILSRMIGTVQPASPSLQREMRWLLFLPKIDLFLTPILFLFVIGVAAAKGIPFLYSYPWVVPIICVFFSVWGLFQAIWTGAYTIEYLVLRFFLLLIGCTPWNYSRFLDYATERILLRKVNGGYAFDHRLFLEHFASLTREETRSLR